jgi:ATP-dependent Zn protease
MDAETKRLAIHEAAHAVLNTYCGIEVQSVYVKANIAQGGCEIDVSSAGWSLESMLLTTLGGMAGELIHQGEATGGKQDFQTAHKIATAIAGKGAYSLIRENMAIAEGILTRQWPAVQAVSDALLRRSRLTGRECRQIIYQTMDGPQPAPPVPHGASRGAAWLDSGGRGCEPPKAPD